MPNTTGTGPPAIMKIWWKYGSALHCSFNRSSGSHKSQIVTLTFFSFPKTLCENTRKSGLFTILQWPFKAKNDHFIFGWLSGRPGGFFFHFVTHAVMHNETKPCETIHCSALCHGGWYFKIIGKMVLGALHYAEGLSKQSRYCFASFWITLDRIFLAVMDQFLFLFSLMSDFFSLLLHTYTNTIN